MGKSVDKQGTRKNVEKIERGSSIDILPWGLSMAIVNWYRVMFEA